MTLAVKLKAGRIWVGEQFSVSFQRKQRVDESSTPVPSWGALPIKSLHDYADHVPDIPDIQNAFLIPVGDNEAVWLGFQGAYFKPNAVKVGFGDRDAIACGEWDDILRSNPQNYLVCPAQLSLETMCVDEVTRLQITPLSADWIANRIRLIVYEPLEDHVASERSDRVHHQANVLHSIEPDAGIKQKITGEIHPDPYGTDTWDSETTGCFQVFMASHEQYTQITGCQPPPAPSPSDVYSGYLLP